MYNIVWLLWSSLASCGTRTAGYERLCLLLEEKLSPLLLAVLPYIDLHPVMHPAREIFGHLPYTILEMYRF